VLAGGARALVVHSPAGAGYNGGPQANAGIDVTMVQVCGILACYGADQSAETMAPALDSGAKGDHAVACSSQSSRCSMANFRLRASSSAGTPRSQAHTTRRVSAFTRLRDRPRRAASSRWYTS